MSINPWSESINDSSEIVSDANLSPVQAEEKVEADLDAILGELDEFLEEDVEEFFENYHLSFYNGE